MVCDCVQAVVMLGAGKAWRCVAGGRCVFGVVAVLCVVVSCVPSMGHGPHPSCSPPYPQSPEGHLTQIRRHHVPESKGINVPLIGQVLWGMVCGCDLV